MAICFTKSKKLIAVCVISFLLTLSVSMGQVSLQFSGYNSEGSFYHETSVENADCDLGIVLLPYEGFSDLPYSIFSVEKGKSTDRSSNKFSSSSSATSNGKSENIGANVATKSGSFEYANTATVSSDGPSMSMAVISEINSGNLQATFSNTNSEFGATVSTDNGQYFSQALITPQLLAAFGAGISQSPDPSGFSSEIWSKNLGKFVQMGTNIEESSPSSEGVDHSWTDIAVLLPGISSMKEVVQIKSREGWLIFQPTMIVPLAGSANGKMEFNALNLESGEPVFETQFVPPRTGQPLYMLAQRDLNNNIMKNRDTIEMSMTANWWSPPS